jgi:hypothetical protein
MDEDGSILVRLGADTNGDGIVTIADVGPWLREILVMPGDAVIRLLVEHAPAIAGFLELGDDDLGGITAFWLSILIWLLALLLVVFILSLIRTLDQRVTAQLVRLFSEVRRRIRVGKRLVVASLRSRRARQSVRPDGPVVESVDLAAPEKAVLRCLSNIDDGAVLTLDELASRLGLPPRDVNNMVRRLVDLGLAEPGMDRMTSREGHRIAVGGQMYLLGV